MHLLPENIVNLAAASTDNVDLPAIRNNQIILDVLRLDKIDPVISGNKWFKLKYYLQDALTSGQKRVLTFGGAYSNHIIATAAAASRAGLESIGLIRGEQPATPSHTLQEAAQLGMQLVYLSRTQYNQKKNPAFIDLLRQEYDNPCMIPEGGEGHTGIRGVAEIVQLTGWKTYSHIVCAVGTGTLLLGLASGAGGAQQVIGVPVLKGFENWQSSIPGIDQNRIHIAAGYEFGGYAKKNNALIDFMNQWFRETGISSDFVYTGKLFFAVNDLIRQGYFPPKSRLLVIHSGGLQGNKSLPAKTLEF